MSSNNSDGLYEQGQSFAEHGNFKEALVAFVRAAEIAPTFGEAWFSVACVHDRLGNIQEARSNYEHYLSIADPNDIQRIQSAQKWLSSHVPAEASTPKPHLQVPWTGPKLDKRAGVKHPKGTYIAVENATPRMMTEEVFAKIHSFCVAGHQFAQRNHHDAAINKFLDAEALLPQPEIQWHAAAWIYTALGEAHFALLETDEAHLKEAHRQFNNAMWCPGALGDPFIHLRLGQLQVGLGNMNRAIDDLVRAYTGGGREIFKNEDPAFIEMVEQVLKPPPGMSRLP